MKKDISITSAIVILMFVLSYVALLSKSMIDIFSQYALFIFGALAIGLMFLRQTLRKGQVQFLFVVLFFLVASIMYNSGGIGSVIVFIFPFLLCFGLEYIILTDTDENIIKVLSVFVICFLFIRSFSYDESWWNYRDTIVNPNTMAQFSVFAYIYFIVFYNNKTQKMNILSFALLIITGISCINYSARGSLIALIAFALGIIFMKKITKKKILIYFMVLVILSTAFPFIYIALYGNNVSTTFLGKDFFTGREIIWGNLLEKFSEQPLNWILGLGSHTDIGMDVLNVHNTPFSIIVNFGIVGFILYYGFILRLFLNIKTYDTITKKMILGFISTTVVLGFSEVTTMWPVSLAMAFCVLGFAIARQNKISRFDLIE